MAAVLLKKFHFQTILQLLNQRIDGKVPGVMIPIPQYPLYSASIAEYNMYQVSILATL